VAVKSRETEKKPGSNAESRSMKMDVIAQLSGGIAHEFNNILGIALGNVEMLEHSLAEGGKATDKQLLYLEKAKKAVLRGAELNKSMAALSRQAPQTYKPININTTVGHLDAFLGGARMPMIKIHYDLEEDLWPVRLDIGEFEDAMINLVLNAQEAMDGAGNLIIRSRNEAVINQTNESGNPINGDHVIVEIADSGRGIEAADVPRLFEPFFSNGSVGSGTGLGLTMVYAFVKRCKGHMQVDTVRGEGTTFRLFFARAKGTGVEADNEQEKTTVTGGDETILVVDDEMEMADYASAVLEHHGYKVVSVNNVEGAKQYLARGEGVDLIFSDIVMPNGSGFELAKYVEQQQLPSKLLLTSGYYDAKALSPAYQVLTDNMLAKPYDRETLLRKVREILDS
jgi:nitrogen-specific signal transduction histidine kinase/CheY-like chemotaxis protein